ncbi:hypothetical protein ANN_24948 [Periplaneta americana]|uniref:Mos1 transposase HTH domain-containing protein n=1 Tax=Periplaneta americana TaxID=6978 RepID=A0ABQ8S028_PERAM|nr:hypothetical protein ANN_24948 [Periplaneta americana]
MRTSEPEMSQFEQRGNIKFCQKLGKTAAEAFQMMQQVYGEDAVSRSVVFRWHRRFLQGRDSLGDDVRTSRPQTIRTERKIQEVATLVRANRSQSVDDIAATVGVSHGTCYKILSDDLNMSRVTQHSVPRILSQDQRDDRTTICGDLISSADNDPTLLNRIITGDETWCFLYDPQLKRHSATWKTPLSSRQKKPRQDRSKGKAMLELFFDSNGIVHMEFIPEGAFFRRGHDCHKRSHTGPSCQHLSKLFPTYEDDDDDDDDDDDNAVYITDGRPIQELDMPETAAAPYSIPESVLDILQQLLNQSDIPLSTMKTASLTYIGGYIVRIVEERVSCMGCLDYIPENTNSSPLMSLIANQDLGALRYPEPTFVSVLSVIHRFVERAVPFIPNKNILENLCSEIEPLLCRCPLLQCPICDEDGQKRLANIITVKFVMPDYDAVVQQHGLVTSVAGLRFEVMPHHFLSGHMQVRCVATISTGVQHSEYHDRTFPLEDNREALLLVFFDSQGLMHHEFIPEGRTVTKELYVETLRRLWDAVRRKRPEKHNITALDHPPYSPDLSPPDYFLFPRLKSHLKGRRFNAEEVIANATRALRRVSQNGFQACFQELYKRWQSV